jgi:hypothetical protein
MDLTSLGLTLLIIVVFFGALLLLAVSLKWILELMGRGLGRLLGPLLAPLRPARPKPSMVKPAPKAPVQKPVIRTTPLATGTGADYSKIVERSCSKPEMWSHNVEYVCHGSACTSPVSLAWPSPEHPPESPFPPETKAAFDALTRPRIDPFEDGYTDSYCPSCGKPFRIVYQTYEHHLGTSLTTIQQVLVENETASTEAT